MYDIVDNLILEDNNGREKQGEHSEYFREWVQTEDCPWYLRQ